MQTSKKRGEMAGHWQVICELADLCIRLLVVSRGEAVFWKSPQNHLQLNKSIVVITKSIEGHSHVIRGH